MNAFPKRAGRGRPLELSGDDFASNSRTQTGPWLGSVLRHDMSCPATGHGFDGGAERKMEVLDDEGGSNIVEVTETL
jgi:hypothetical protein